LKISQSNLKNSFLFRALLIIIIELFLFSACNFKRATFQCLNTPYSVIDQNDNKRTYRLFIDRSKKDSPLMVYFHGVISPEFKKIPTLKGYTGSPVEETGLISFCKINQIALLVIDPLYEYNFLNCRAKGWLINQELPGAEKVIDLVVENFSIDKKNIFLAGISAGASFCHHLANNRPDFYAGIISHSQAYVSQDGKLLKPKVKGPRFGVLFTYNKNDYPQLIDFCQKSWAIYRQEKYRTTLIPDVLPPGHTWSKMNNYRFWKMINKLKKTD